MPCTTMAHSPKSNLENAISNLEMAVQLTDDGHPDQPRYLTNLGSAQQVCFKHLGDWSDLENAISNLEKAVQLTDDEHPQKPGHLSNLGGAQQICFSCLDDLSDLKNAIINQEKAVHLTRDDTVPFQPSVMAHCEHFIGLIFA